jgi:DNA-binding CsgD family transcriptional regulator
MVANSKPPDEAGRSGPVPDIDDSVGGKAEGDSTMLEHVRPRMPEPAKIESVDALLEPMLRAARAGQPLEPPLLEIVRAFGFESFVYGIATATRPNRDSRSLVWTSLPHAWVQAYEENAYVEVDPRVASVFDRASPYVWDASSIGGCVRSRRFLEHAANYGIRSGVVIGLTDLSGSRVGFGLNSSLSPVSRERRDQITLQLGTFMLLGTRLHDLFMSHVVRRGIPPVQQGKPLSRREKQCLEMAARGMTSADIGIKLGITDRGANFHFGNILSKLAALNRNEAIAKAITLGLIRI